MVRYLPLVALLVAALAPLAPVRGTGYSSPPRRARSPRAVKIPRVKPRCASCPRDAKGRIPRSATAKRDFQKSHPCPSTRKTTGGCPGYVVDHIVPLKRGGADTPSNMRWQTIEAAKAKDKIE